MAHETDTSQALDQALEQGFAELRRDTEIPSASLIGRLVADAHQVQNRPSYLVRLWQRFAGLAEPIGGLRGSAALAASAVLGLWLGYAQPIPVGSAALPELSDEVMAADPLAMFEDFVVEG